jgi:hypothetical protein
MGGIAAVKEKRHVAAARNFQHAAAAEPAPAPELKSGREA